MTGVQTCALPISGESCPNCGSALRIDTAVEIGHIFKLGYKYSESMNARVLDRNGKEVTLIMGCYGIGIERILTAAIEQSNDENGFWLPPSIAPLALFSACRYKLAMSTFVCVATSWTFWPKMALFGPREIVRLHRFLALDNRPIVAMGAWGASVSVSSASFVLSMAAGSGPRPFAKAASSTRLPCRSPGSP